MIDLLMPNLANTYSAYTIILGLLLVYLFINYGTNKLIQIEWKKRKEILKKLKELKEPYLRSHPVSSSTEEGSDAVNLIERMKQENNYATTIHLQESLSEEELAEMHVKAKSLKKEYQAKPYLIVLSFAFSLIVFVQILFYLSGIDTIEHYIVMSAAIAIITFLTGVTRKSIWFYLIFSLLLFLIYSRLSGALNIFLLLYFSWNFLKKRVYAPWKKKRTPKAPN